MITIKTEDEIQAMREGGRMLATVLQAMRNQARPGLTPKDMAAIAASELKKLGGQPAFLGFHGYPDVICISVNNQVQHSIPNTIPFRAGDVVNFDFGVRWKDMITDGGITVCIGDEFTSDTKRLLAGTEKALKDALAVVKDGVRVGDISAVIERTLRKNKLGIVRELVGHGVGHALHEDPEIPNYGSAGRGPVLKAGMTIAIEPITTLGDPAIFEARDGWTLLTQDGSWSAQFEHTILVTKTGCEILTTV
ncbi:MAG TPA: type I methionyl aminopeptidase [Candidatus Saccharimonadales bacterium]|nr:type I methionyl aminopeptidase [Candidatus Saccharimonadales bacterium]